ncbi:MAG: hypothetical protein IM550_18975 [Microcystis sp. M54BS1]|uniref:hypothetical protein n=1 Tax=unclassified Microcystis TaxID=2643300 RepID=UPI00257A4473|nr:MULTISPECIES: hypothetical protein [unclassified Microcystis]MCA2541220.1 hypothetical protein [Microcystis sp. M54BS1]MCA2594462.1 hypothetical protein [Microcystis sp. M38BS1]MCA2611483.1 hypothetical protein [Microcystis sp. M27BS1]MCA2507282.1 hypothetical protein [Microcystis sp. M62BS1]MCA2510192.1 hypothetical protein [Microcystis sp. M60BS1]
MVRSPKSIAGAVGLALGNAPYKSGDRTEEIKPHNDKAHRRQWSVAELPSGAAPC